ncbi:MAG: hypothetical protein A2143_08020 [Gallionellales bacterium RBG_16_57_15]|nr:MAG: hypothetical protein A2143_08020 [Gallionellales bacterium RBG_16_57_15]
MALIERLMGIEEPKIQIHAFQSIMAEWARGNFTGAQAQAAIAFVSHGVALDSAAATEAQALVATVPTGSTATNKADRALKLQEIDQVLLLVDAKCPPYDVAANVRTRLGI